MLRSSRPPRRLLQRKHRSLPDRHPWVHRRVLHLPVRRQVSRSHLQASARRAPRLPQLQPRHYQRLFRPRRCSHRHLCRLLRQSRQPQRRRRLLRRWPLPPSLRWHLLQWRQPLWLRRQFLRRQYLRRLFLRRLFLRRLPRQHLPHPSRRHLQQPPSLQWRLRRSPHRRLLVLRRRLHRSRRRHRHQPRHPWFKRPATPCHRQRCRSSKQATSRT